MPSFNLTIQTPQPLKLIVQPPAEIKSTLVVGQGPAGAQGIQGVPGGSSVVAISNIAIGGHRLVVLDTLQYAQYATNQDLTHANKVLGMTTNAASAGGEINVVRIGEVEENMWSWTLNLPVYLGVDGVPTQTQPENLFSLIVGFPITPTKLFVSIREPIIF